MIRPLIALLFLVPAAAAQDIQLNARIAKTDAALCPPHEHFVEGTSVFLDDALVDLDPFVGDIVLVRGTELATTPCAAKTIRVAAVEPPRATLEVCGTGAIGCPMRFLVGPPTVSFNFLAVSAAPQPVANAGQLGVLFLGTPYVVLNPGPGGVTDLVVPGDGALLGANLTFQGFHLEVGPIQGPGMLTNPVNFDVVVAILCHPADCTY